MFIRGKFIGNIHREPFIFLTLYDDDDDDGCLVYIRAHPWACLHICVSVSVPG